MATKPKKEYSELKKRAFLAKQRLKMGYWQKLMDEREAASTSDALRVQQLQRDKVRRDQDKALGGTRADEEELFYSRVCRILEEDEDVADPIGKLMDRDAIQGMDEGNRQRYILQLAQKFREMRERYYRERGGKSG